ncbi:hypothetical protein HMPREF0591_2040, partial [Mycobacterium parascrofulaceum ATCC BAA-614]
APAAGGTSFRSFRTRSQTGKQARVEPAAEEPAADERPGDAPGAKRKRRLFRLPVLAAIVGTAAAVLLVGTAVAIGLNSANQSATTPAVTKNPAPAPPAHTATAQPPPPTAEAPPPSTADTHPPATTETPSSSAPSAKPQHAPPLAAAPVRPAVPQVPQAPPIPPVPGLGEPIPGMDRVNQIIQGIAGDLGISGIPQLGPQLGTTR